MKIVLLLFTVAVIASAQRITTIQLDGVQYFVSRMNPYSPELNYFLAYQYCRSLGLQLASFETKEKADTMTQYLKNAGYDKFDFWTSGNKLGTDMYLWMSTGQPFNATFDNMVRRPVNRPSDVPPGTEPQRVARESGDSGSANSCVAMVKPTLSWDTQDCSMIKDFICEQTRCYYYNYGSIPVSATQGSRKPEPTTTTTTTPHNDDDQHYDTAVDNSEADSTDTEAEQAQEHEESSSDHEDSNLDDASTPEDPVVGRLMGSLGADSLKHGQDSIKVEKSRTEDIPDITSLFTSGLKRPEAVFEGLQTHEIRSLQRQQNYDKAKPMPDNGLEESKTIGPYDSVHDYVNDEPASGVVGETSKDQEDDSSTPYPDAEPAYRYNIKVRSNGKVLDPPSK